MPYLGVEPYLTDDYHFAKMLMGCDLAKFSRYMGRQTFRKASGVRRT